MDSFIDEAKAFVGAGGGSVSTLMLFERFEREIEQFEGEDEDFVNSSHSRWGSGMEKSSTLFLGKNRCADNQSFKMTKNIFSDGNDLKEKKSEFLSCFLAENLRYSKCTNSIPNT